MKPAKHILDRAFHYRPSYATDIRKTFRRAQRAPARPPATSTASRTVVPLKKTG